MMELEDEFGEKKDSDIEQSEDRELSLSMFTPTQLSKPSDYIL